MYRAAQAATRPGGPHLFAEMVQELAQILGAATAFVAVFSNESRSEMRTLAAVLDGRPLRNFDYALQGSPCAQVVGRSFRHVARGWRPSSARFCSRPRAWTPMPRFR